MPAKESRGQLKATVPVTILNVSAVGMLFELASALRTGAVYDLRALVAGIPLAAHVRITRCRAGAYADDGRGGRNLVYRAGAEFVGLDAAALEKLLAALASQGSVERSGVLRRAPAF